MAIMCKCDRCQKIFKPTKKENAVIKVQFGLGEIGVDNSLYDDPNEPFTEKLYELCDDCFKELKNSLTKYNREEVENNEKRTS